MRRKRYREATILLNKLYLCKSNNKDNNKINKNKKTGQYFFQASLIGLKRYLKKSTNKLRVRIISYK